RKRDPLLDDIPFNGVDWGGVQELNLLATPLVSCGGWTLLSRLRGTLTVAYLLNIDLEASTLATSGDWPVLIESLINLRRKKMPGLHRWNFRRGEQIEFELRKSSAGSATTHLTLTHEKTSRRLRRGRTVVVPTLTLTGRYEVRDGEKTIARFAVNFLDERESELSQLAPGRRLPLEEAPRDGFLLDQPHSWLILAAIVAVLALLLTNWRLLQPSHVSR
ncbi:MAG: hypothetical protein IID45_05785, partial [Planctomycetes bacterium]|nr:hypothetical protein [Planctomycetota bacterium]